MPARTGGRGGGERGQVLPALLVMVFLLVGSGLLLLQIGQAAVLQGGAQTAADAAALAGANEARRQLYSADRYDASMVDWGAVEAAARDYAERNGASIPPGGFDHQNLDVIVTAVTDDALGDRAAELGAEGRRGESRARARVEVIQVPFPDGGGGAGETIAPPADAPEFVRRAWDEANRIDALTLPYLWGGGHQSSPAPAGGPYDCSGSVSRVLQAAGLPIPTMVSGQFMSVGEPGPGRVSIYANDGHVYMSIDGRFFGTGGQNPGGGAGWLDPYSARPGFVVRHIPLDGDFVPANLVGVGAGSAFSPAAFAARFEVVLVPLDG